MIREVTEDDGLPWRIRQQPEQLVVIGDLHGDHDALRRIARDLGLWTAETGWDLGRTHLVLLGDINDRGWQTRPLVDKLIALESRYPGQVHALLGNPELRLVREDRARAPRVWGPGHPRGHGNQPGRLGSPLGAIDSRGGGGRSFAAGLEALLSGCKQITSATPGSRLRRPAGRAKVFVRPNSQGGTP